MDMFLLSAVLLLLSSYIVFSLEVLAADRCRVQGGDAVDGEDDGDGPDSAVQPGAETGGESQ